VGEEMMSQEKQIEELAKIFCGMKNGCDGCMWDKVHCNERNYAVEIYNAGYRKQSVGEWIKDNTSNFEHRYNCSVCDFRQVGKPTPYCPNCGARMGGGAG
jgi:hypothetical protein